jgi:hypothetical protein
MKRYLNAVESFTPTDQFAMTSKVVEDFLADKEKVAAIKNLLQQKFDSLDSWVNKKLNTMVGGAI